MRLVDENGMLGGLQGRVEIYYNQEWGTICDDNWGDADASVICQQLGLSEYGTATGDSRYGGGEGIIWLNNVDCDGDEDNLDACGHDDWGQHNCNHREDAGVSCVEQPGSVVLLDVKL